MIAGFKCEHRYISNWQSLTIPSDSVKFLWMDFATPSRDLVIFENMTIIQEWEGGMALVELNSREIDAVSGAAAGDVTVVTGPGGTVVTLDLGNGQSIESFYDTAGNLQYFQIIDTPRVVQA